jgi:hypothetical protein
MSKTFRKKASEWGDTNKKSRLKILKETISIYNLFTERLHNERKSVSSEKSQGFFACVVSDILRNAVPLSSVRGNPSILRSVRNYSPDDTASSRKKSLSSTALCQKILAQIHSPTSETVRSTVQLHVRNCLPNVTTPHLRRSESSATCVRS